MDLLIATAALVDAAPVVTRNVQDFSRIPGLEVMVPESPFGVLGLGHATTETSPLKRPEPGKRGEGWRQARARPP